MSDLNSTHDLEQRKLDQDRVRERKQRQKWHFGEAAPSTGHPSRRPSKPATSAGSRFWRREGQQCHNKSAKMDRTSGKPSVCVDKDTDASSLDSSDETQSPIAGLAPDAAYTYSYDAPTGPSKGSHILGQAVAKAVEKYETKEMERLVKDEYDVVESEKEEQALCTSNDEDDFEIIE